MAIEYFLTGNSQEVVQDMKPHTQTIQRVSDARTSELETVEYLIRWQMNIANAMRSTYLFQTLEREKAKTPFAVQRARYRCFASHDSFIMKIVYPSAKTLVCFLHTHTKENTRLFVTHIMSIQISSNRK